MRRLGLVLAATYPDGSLGSVVAFKPLLGAEQDDLFEGLRAHPLLDEALSDITSFYHSAIGPAYDPDDFAYTLFDIADDQALFDLVGVRMLATHGLISAVQRPEVTG